MFYRTGKYIVCGRVRASFSPKILRAAAVKGLNQIKPTRHLTVKKSGGREQNAPLNPQHSVTAVSQHSVTKLRERRSVSQSKPPKATALFTCSTYRNHHG